MSKYPLLEGDIVDGEVSYITPQLGAIVAYASPNLRGKDVSCWKIDGNDYEKKEHFHANIVERKVRGESVFAALFPQLERGTYRVSLGFAERFNDVTVYSGSVTEVDWR